MTADLDEKALARCRHIIAVTAATSGFQWQCYVPTLGLLVSKDLGRDITDLAWLYAAFVGMSIVSSISLHAHLQHFSPYTVRVA